MGEINAQPKDQRSDANPSEMMNVQLPIPENDIPPPPSSAPPVPPPSTSSSSGEPSPSSDEPSPSDPMDPTEKLFKTLLLIFVLSSAFMIFVWFMCGAGFPWFIYISYAVGLVELIIYAVKTKKYSFINLSIFGTTNVMLFLTFLASGGGYPWFIFPLCSMAILPVSEYIIRKYEGFGLRFLYVHAAIYLLINVMLTLVWMVNSTRHPFPWFIYPWAGWGVALLIQYNVTVMHDIPKLLIYLCADITCMLMITFRFAMGPLFAVFLLLGIFAGMAYFVARRKGYTAHFQCLKRAQPSPPASPSPSPAHAEAGILPQQPSYPQQPYPPQPSPQVYQNAPPHPMFYPPVFPGSNNAPVYYYYPNTVPQPQIYPSMYPHLGPSAPNPPPSNAILSVEAVKDNEHEEGERLLSNDTKSYSSPKL